MDKKIAGLLGAVAGLATVSSAQASTGPAQNATEGPQASSYADLLAPIPNAVELLKADNAARAQNIELAQWNYYYPYYSYTPYPYRYYHHHHHHHHHAYAHHHHHHHHNSAFIGIPGVGGAVIGGR